MQYMHNLKVIVINAFFFPSENLARYIYLRYELLRVQKQGEEN